MAEQKKKRENYLRKKERRSLLHLNRRTPLLPKEGKEKLMFSSSQEISKFLGHLRGKETDDPHRVPGHLQGGKERLERSLPGNRLRKYKKELTQERSLGKKSSSSVPGDLSPTEKVKAPDRAATNLLLPLRTQLGGRQKKPRSIAGARSWGLLEVS